ncbi:rhamnan synthesis F family protein [Variovorax paradoxus]|jgi:glycosyltransferase involved in cell wall biosynthesis|uniref:rhamnan synthesis F family protein n=1 Tax=Variovorax paradoxus TaxID=34073 RepID=UPI0029C6EF1E|nr:rhamnan synthesis F family protein [Variovorax paradoxus]WPH19228.1 rhamnan synthesis F family protein [Variovorax paradoxus]
MQPRIVVELGTHNGVLFAAFCEAAKRASVSSRCYAVNTWQGDEHAGHYGNEIFNDLNEFVCGRYADVAELLRMTFDEARDYFADGSIDLLHIDGLRTYEAVKHDFETWLPKLSQRAVVLFHDTNVRERDFGVWRLWAELQSRYPSFEFLHEHGLGVLAVGEQVDASVRGLCSLKEASNSAFVRFRDRVSQLGARWIAEDLAIRTGEHARALELERTRLEAALADHRLHALDLEARSAQLSAEITRLQSEKEEAEEREEQRLQELRALQDQIAATYASTSWRITRPLRAFSTAIGRVAQRRAPIEKKPSPDSSVDLSGFFDRTYYASQLPSALKENASLEHYLAWGEAAGLAPSPMFDPVFYRTCHDDLKDLESGLLDHYVRCGKTEGRRGRSATDDILISTERFVPGRACLVVAAHEASRTGAAILSWNLVLELQKKYNVIVLLKRDGPLVSNFEEAAAAIVTVPDEVLNPVELAILARKVTMAHSPLYLIANSVETRCFVPGFENAGVPTIALVHEFSSSVRPRGALHELFLLASRIVFSAQIVADAALKDYAILAAREFHVLPQGQSRLPSIAEPQKQAEPQTKSEFGRKDFYTAPTMDIATLEADVFLVVGLGTITARKGVEFFIAAADRARRSGSKRKIVFAWVGKCYSFDETYLESLREQLERADLKDAVVFLGEYADLAPVYQRADLCFLSSRLDPLPNIAIDAALLGIPVVCFDRASGFAEILRERPDTRRLVVPHMDSAAAADLIVELAENPGELAVLKNTIRKMALELFDMQRYVSQIDDLGTGAKKALDQLEENRNGLVGSDTFNASFFSGPRGTASDEAEVRTAYLRDSLRVMPRSRPRTGLVVRRPLEGFHPLIYAEENTDFDESSGEDPLVHFLRTGRPAGRWKHEVLKPRETSELSPVDLKVAVHGHFHYPELLSDFLSRLSGNRTPVDLLLTTTSAEKAAVLSDLVAKHDVSDATIMVVENRGRDIGPMLNALGASRFEHYDVIGHFHGKRSPHVDEAIGGEWREFLWQHLIGDDHPMMDLILKCFAENPDVGLVFPEDPHLNDWDQNRLHAEQLAQRMGIALPLPNHLDFPQGTMFWARPDALKPMFDLALALDEFPSEPVPIDGTMLHALERLLPFSANKMGYRYITTHVKAHRR